MHPEICFWAKNAVNTVLFNNLSRQHKDQVTLHFYHSCFNLLVANISFRTLSDALKYIIFMKYIENYIVYILQFYSI